ncbi:outer dynein arm-docking complex subunit 4 [Patella vulgata]|uniref:outer dynein arm-docking complex subunit 4 n=1 Tax=Patella vulgata TaxID=6465 RepID=UPI00217F5448|nr:outer dynein arm-docking complex subunit 4 [Patella vulgata]
MYEEESDEPKGTFEIYKAEADTLYKQGEYRKAIESYTTALEIQDGDKNCLVARSKCHLQLGDTTTALADAELSLDDDKSFHKGIFQKAEALYYQGDFEMALVFYHRGCKLRPELQEFRLGIQKAQEAIDNSVGSAEKCKLSTAGDLSFFTNQDEKQKKRKPGMGTFGRPAVQQKEKRKVSRSQGSEKTVKQLLGELYGDRKYLEKLLKETADASSETGKSIFDLVEEGLSYLDTRTDFWRQQKPMYARKHERMQQHRSKRQETQSKGGSPNAYIISELEKIDQAHGDCKYKDSLNRAQKCLKTVEGYSPDTLSNRDEVIANLHSCMGNSYLELGQYGKALEQHQLDLNIGEETDNEECISRGLDNVGRVHARSGNFQKAIGVWNRKLPMSKSALENTWLYHEVGRCHLELTQYTEARHFGEKSLAAAEEAADLMWQLQASVLLAQSQVKLNELQSALESFEKALDLAKLQGDKAAESAIQKAIIDVNKRIAREVKEKENQEETNPETESQGAPAEDTTETNNTT